MTLPVAFDTLSCERVSGKIGVFVEDEPCANPDVYKPIGCCITQAQRPGLNRNSNVASSCINIVDCDDPVSEANCSGVPGTSAGDQQESTFTFSTNDTPGSPQTLFLEYMQKCGRKLSYMLCHPNGVRQVIDAAWVQSVVPDQISGDTDFATVAVTLNLAGDWTYFRNQGTAQSPDWQEIPEHVPEELCGSCTDDQGACVENVFASDCTDVGDVWVQGGTCP